MCIRDSNGIARGHLPRRATGRGHGPHVAVIDVTRIGGVVPVSYTHLRAHETVLDLVCRLLLEKKKQ